MKRLFIFIILCCFIFTGCSKNTTADVVAEKQADSTNIDLQVVKEIESLENVNDLSDETIKSLSIISRTNLMNETQKKINENYTPKNKKIYELVKQTENQILIDENNSQSENFKIENQKEETWIKEIKKGDILKFLNKNKIKLSSTSNIKPEKDEFGKTTKLNLNGKIVSFEKIMKEFNLPSNNIEYIENNLTNIKIYGKGQKNDQVFNIFEAEKLSKQGFGYEKILKNSQNNFQIITRK